MVAQALVLRMTPGVSFVPFVLYLSVLLDEDNPFSSLAFNNRSKEAGLGSECVATQLQSLPFPSPALLTLGWVCLYSDPEVLA